jgi:DNA repair exonuclease SbcCD nuclease subunit
LYIAQQAHVDLVIYMGDMFDLKHIDALYIKRTKDLLSKYGMRALSICELLLPQEDAVDVSQTYDSTPFIQLCGNHEEMCVLDLLPTTKVKS